MEHMDKRMTGLAFWIEERDNTDGIALTMEFMPARLIHYGPNPQKRGRPERLNL
jgi:hypothetical protein